MKTLLLASLALALLGLVAAWLLGRFRIQSPLLHRITWGLVLSQGVFLAGIPLELPVLSPKSALPSAIPREDVSSPAALSRPQETRSAGGEIVAGPVGDGDGRAATESKRAPGNPLVWLYGAGAAGVAGFFLLSYLALLWTARRSVPAPAGWSEPWRALLERHGVGEIPLRVHPGVGPMLCRLPGGYRLIVPEPAWRRLTPEQREAIFEHELGHVLRHDIWKSLAARCVALVHWFNPVAWWSVRQFEEAAEWDCDRRLAAQGREKAAAFARALLQFSEPGSPPLGASLARGAALSPRIRRLTRSGELPEKMGKKCAFVLLMAGLALCALIRIELIAQEEEPGGGYEPPDEAFRARVDEFSENIRGSGELLASFRDVIGGPAGRIVMRDRAGEAADRERNERARHALQDFLDRHFAEDGETGKLVLRPGSGDLDDRILEMRKTIESDIATMDSAFVILRDSLSPDSEAEQLMIRVTESEGAAALIYSEAIAERMRPSMRMMTDRVSAILSDPGDGSLVIPPSRASEAEKAIELGRAIVRLRGQIEAELRIFVEDIATPDALHRRVRRNLEDPLFAVFLAAVSVEDAMRERRTSSVIEIFEHLEGGFIDRGDGLHINPEEREEVIEHMTHFESLRERLPLVAAPLHRLADRIRKEDERHQAIREVLTTEGLAMFFSFEMDLVGGDAGEIFLDLVGEVLETGEDGKRRVRKEEREEAIEKMRQFLRQLRDARRRGRQFDRIAGQIGDEALADAFRSPGGKLAVARTIREEIESLSIDGLSLWIDRHFLRGENGALTLRADAAGELEEIISDARGIEENLKSDF